jgi:hypothetical protein
MKLLGDSGKESSCSFGDGDGAVIFSIVAAAAVVAMRATLLVIRAQRQHSRHGGSRVGKAPNRNIGRHAAARSLDKDYFQREGGTPRLVKSEFERRFRMPRCIYENLRDAALFDPYVQVIRDAAGVQGATTDQKIVTALCQLTLGLPADAVVEYSSLSESTCDEALKRFVETFHKSSQPLLNITNTARSC